jgi:uncharacterized tellurite resistance protein B-like protein
MYTTQVKTQDEALCHLFFHCCLKDGALADTELNYVSDKLVAVGLNKELNFKDQMIAYRSYIGDMTNEEEYLQYLVELINPVNEMALYSHCAELLLSDNVLAPEEESLLKRLGDALGIDDTEQSVAKKLMIQRKVVETEKIF